MLTSSFKALSMVFVMAAVGLVWPSRASAQLPTDPVERARAIAETHAANATQVTIFDRRGNVLDEVGSRELYGQPALSPDGNRIAVMKWDLEKRRDELIVLDIATGGALSLTAGQSYTRAQDPVWSPDSSEIAYVASRSSYFELYRRPSDGSGTEELLYRSNVEIRLTDWSLDGRHLAYFASDIAGAAAYALPLEASGERKPIVLFLGDHLLRDLHFSPDGRYISYASEESGRSEIYVRPFASDQPGQRQASNGGGTGLAFWRSDGKELFYLGSNRALMSVAVTSNESALELATPTVLFRAPDSVQIDARHAHISRDGARIVAAVPPTTLKQLTVFDREGKIVKTIGEPAVYFQPRFSPNGDRIVAMKEDLDTGNVDIWTLDVATGNGTPITSDPYVDTAPIWSPDGKYVAYVSTRGVYADIYRKAADGAGAEELLFRYTPGARMVLTDWSPDGKLLSFYTKVLVLVPLDGQRDPLEREAIDWLREEYDIAQGTFSPDGRYIAYLSDEAEHGRFQVYIRPFDPTNLVNPASAPALQVSTDAARGLVTFRQDGKELYFITRDWQIMAVDLQLGPTPQTGTPRPLFKLRGPLPGNPPQWKSVSADGQRFVFAIPLWASEH